MKNKYIFVGIIIIILVISVFFLYNKKSIQTEVVYTNTTPRDVDWEKSLPAIHQAFQKDFLGNRVGETYPVKIYQIGDITGDGISEVIIDMGLQGGYSSSTFMTLMMVQNSKPIKPEFKLQNGSVTKDYVYEVGEGAQRTEDLKLLPAKKTVYEIIQVNATNLKECLITAYQWNSEIKIFEFNQKLSDEIKLNMCR